MKSESASYKAAGVDITAGYRAVELMRSHVERTLTPGAVGGLGGFGGLFRPDLTGIAKPILVSGTDGVGTKLRLAFLLDKHDTVGIDCVAMCVNDVICAGAAPLFFLDYIACGRNLPDRIAAIVSGVAEGCVQAGCALIGGETAEMPGFYPEDEYDLAGFAVGLADEEKLVDHSAMRPGDAVLALPSSGVHSNGFSLVRKVFDVEHQDLTAHIAELDAPLGETLLTPTRIYVKPVLSLLQAVPVSGLAHITGGGFFENMPRCLGPGCGVRIEKQAVRTPPIFDLIMKEGHIPERDMFNTFNMGVGMIAVVPQDKADEALRVLRAAGEDAYALGEIVAGEGVELC
ncbi:MAG: phosphoribosylformylglycinamidine cyclo-ligase [Firmicutes bacterium]|nr:phosphoribosylformylglycinamidine cyclo-ligase [Bacillota bacterium]